MLAAELQPAPAANTSLALLLAAELQPAPAVNTALLLDGINLVQLS
jgi:hypothetical protein